ncbi:MAG: hypothetical protein H0U13_07100 [Gemmatimonadaceae bacterium]|nr:hypothetical protein [Gemmatimonadaceae bacterium]
MGLTIRALNCPPRARGVLRSLLGIERRHEGPADIRVRFVERISWSNDQRRAGPDAVWDGRHFGVRQPGGWLLIPFADLDEPSYELMCEQGVSGLPILRSLLQIQALRKGFVPVHGSAFLYRGLGFIATGWPRAAKTGMMLAAVDGGGAVIAAENACVDPESLLLFKATEPVRTRAWHVRQLGSDRLVGANTRTRLLFADRMLEAATRFGVKRGFLSHVHAAATRRNSVDMWAGPLRYASSAIRLGAIVFLISTRGGHVSASNSNNRQLAAQRLLLLFEEELIQLSSHYHRYRFLVPSENRSLIDDARTRYQHLLGGLLQRVTCHEVLHSDSPAFSELRGMVNVIVDGLLPAEAHAAVSDNR